MFRNLATEKISVGAMIFKRWDFLKADREAAAPYGYSVPCAACLFRPVVLYQLFRQKHMLFACRALGDEVINFQSFGNVHINLPI